MKHLSIIVPIYNVEPYVERCLRSLEDQDIPKADYEIICINDGSPDNSRGIVLRLQQEFDNINLIDQENQGVSLARNNGIDKAGGKYLMFIDPDDYVDANSLNNILKNADTQEAQVSFSGFTYLNADGTIFNQAFNEIHTSQVYQGTKAYYVVRGEGRMDPDSMCGVLIKTEFLNLNNLRYLPYVPFLEDGEFIARILCLAEICIFDYHSFYQRVIRPGSAINSRLFHSEKATYGFLSAALNLKRFQQEQNLSEIHRCFLNQPICKFALLTVNSALQRPFIKNYQRIKSELIKNNFKKLELKGVAKPYNYSVFIYNYFFAVFLFKAYLKEIRRILKAFLNGKGIIKQDEVPQS